MLLNIAPECRILRRPVSLGEPHRHPDGKVFFNGLCGEPLSLEQGLRGKHISFTLEEVGRVGVECLLRVVYDGIEISLMRYVAMPSFV